MVVLSGVVLTDGQRADCVTRGVPPPPPDSEAYCGSKGDVFDWRRPKETEPVGENTPVSFRWRFHGNTLVVFAGYGWCRAEWAYRRDVPRRGPKEFYGLLDAGTRDRLAAELLSA